MGRRRPSIIKGLTPPLDPPKGSIPTGDTFTDSQGRSHIVYRNRFRDFDGEKAKKEVVGKRKGDHGKYPVYRRPKIYVTREFIMRGSPQGHAGPVFEFRPTKAEIERAKRMERREKFLDALAERVSEQDAPLELVIERLLGKQAAKEPEDEPLEVEIIERSGGWFDVFVNGEKQNETALRRDDAERVKHLLEQGEQVLAEVGG